VGAGISEIVYSFVTSHLLTGDRDSRYHWIQVKKAWQERNYSVILEVTNIIPGQILEEDSKIGKLL
jgi:uncharacterized lipoprotein